MLGSLAARLSLDVTDDASVADAIAAAGDLDALVSNAGETVRAPVETLPIGELERLFRLNTVGALRVIQAVLPGFRARGGGRVLFVSSVLGRISLPLAGAYAASKWALEALAETLSLEAGPLGIGVTLLEPGQVATDARAAAPVLVDADGPYTSLVAGRAPDSSVTITPADVACAVVDALEARKPPLRQPVGVPAAIGLAELAIAPMDVPFVWRPRTA